MLVPDSWVCRLCGDVYGGAEAECSCGLIWSERIAQRYECERAGTSRIEAIRGRVSRQLTFGNGRAASSAQAERLERLKGEIAAIVADVQDWDAPTPGVFPVSDDERAANRRAVNESDCTRWPETLDDVFSASWPKWMSVGVPVMRWETERHRRDMRQVGFRRGGRAPSRLPVLSAPEAVLALPAASGAAVRPSRDQQLAVPAPVPAGPPLSKIKSADPKKRKPGRLSDRFEVELRPASMVCVYCGRPYEIEASRGGYDHVPPQKGLTFDEWQSRGGRLYSCCPDHNKALSDFPSLCVVERGQELLKRYRNTLGKATRRGDLDGMETRAEHLKALAESSGQWASRCKCPAHSRSSRSSFPDPSRPRR